MSTQTFEQIRLNLKKRTLFEEVKITPTLAKALLELNTDNRPLRQRIVKMYAEHMKRGDWKFTGGVIAISKSGKLLDGQHRLEAIVTSNTSQLYNIQTGLDDDVFDVLDTGRNRSAGDALYIKGYDNPGLLQAAIKLVIGYDNKTLAKVKTMETSKRPTNHEIATWMEGHDEALMIECIQKGKECYHKTRLMAPATYAGFLYIFARKSKTEAFDFFDKLSSGENISSSMFSPVWVLRNKFINMRDSRNTFASEERYALIIKAWNFFREKSQVKRLSWNDEESFPKAK